MSDAAPSSFSAFQPPHHAAVSCALAAFAGLDLALARAVLAASSRFSSEPDAVLKELGRYLVLDLAFRQRGQGDDERPLPAPPAIVGALGVLGRLPTADLKAWKAAGAPIGFLFKKPSARPDLVRGTAELYEKIYGEEPPEAIWPRDPAAAPVAAPPSGTKGRHVFVAIQGWPENPEMGPGETVLGIFDSARPARRRIRKAIADEFRYGEAEVYFDTFQGPGSPSAAINSLRNGDLGAEASFVHHKKSSWKEKWKADETGKVMIRENEDISYGYFGGEHVFKVEKREVVTDAKMEYMEQLYQTETEDEDE